MTGKLDQATFLNIVRDTPLVSIDLIIRNDQGAILLGQRCNKPAQGYWFVPGGRVLKNESLAQAFQRLCHEELASDYAISSAASRPVMNTFIRKILLKQKTSIRTILSWPMRSITPTR